MKITIFWGGDCITIKGEGGNSNKITTKYYICRQLVLLKAYEEGHLGKNKGMLRREMLAIGKSKLASKLRVSK